MLQASLSSSYERYKADSDFVAAWLANTARSCGYDMGISKAPRLKGKTRKAARDTIKGSVPASTSKEETYRIKIKDFVPLAQAITRSTAPRIKVSRSFAYCLQEAIAQRKHHQKWYSRQDEKNGPGEYQDGHAYFIGILEQVQKTLKCAPVPDANSGSNEPSTSPDKGPLGNMFEQLTFEETVDAPDDHETPKQANTAAKSAKFTPDLGESKAEALFAAVFLFKDVHDIQAQICDLWQRYQKGNLDLVAASVTTNTGIDFVRYLQEDFEARFPGQYELSGRSCLYCASQHDAAAQSNATGYVPSSCLGIAHEILVGLVKHAGVSANRMPSVVPESMELYNVNVDRTTMSMEERCHEALELAMGVIAEYRVLIETTIQVEAEHELVRGLRQLQVQKKPIFWLSFAVQIYLEIRHVLREEVAMAFEEFRRGASNIASTIKRVLDFHKTSDPDDSALKQLLYRISRWTEDDPVGASRRRLQLDSNLSDHMPAHYLLERDPLWCGLLLYKFKVLAYEGAIGKANWRSSIIATAHFYNCLRQAKLLEGLWIDMETVISTQGVSRVFIGSLPTTSQASFKHYQLATGTSPQNFARNRRGSHLKISVSQVRRLERQIPISWMFKHRFCDGSGRTGIEPKDIQEILDKSVKVAKKTTGLKSAAKVNVCQLLDQLADTLHQEGKELTFDYFEMHMICCKILRRLAFELGCNRPDWYHFNSFEENMPGLVFLLLEDAAEGAENGARLRSLIDAGVILDRFVASEGGLVTSKCNEPMMRHQVTLKCAQE